MGFEVDNMDIHFNKIASDYDRHFYEDLGMCEFYDEIEIQINECGNPKNILVLGCGTGLEIERIKHSAVVTAIDISPGMLAELKKKELYPQVTLNTICSSYFDVTFTENNFDLVLSTYSFHHFTLQQKAQLYRKIYNCLKVNAYFINGDTVCRDKDTEINLINNAEEFYQRQQLPFGSMHIDIPLALDTELALFSDTGFRSVTVERRWNKTALIKATK
jgi:ubiquinone/menaquinone biosynthesis C-methylase UbiE